MNMMKAVTTVPSRSFNQNTGAAKKAASEGPVIITERGTPTHVLLTFEAYQSLVGDEGTIGDLLYMPGVADVELDIPSCADLARAADFPDVPTRYQCHFGTEKS